jgi:hypothetical protein
VIINGTLDNIASGEILTPTVDFQKPQILRQLFQVPGEGYVRR